MDKYRKEIDGLRALAIIPVILFHAGFEAFSGGYIGVDIFFVISGYLITSIIIKEKEEGSFSLINFYERRARRLLPSLILVMGVSIIGAWYILLPNDFKNFSKSIIGVLFYSSNIIFWLESGYFDANSENKPLLHTWSLAVEEQFYILFPFILLFVWKFRKKWMVPVFLLIAIISFALAQWGEKNAPVASFYLLPTRGWEILIGTLIALNKINKYNSNKAINEFMGIIGIVLILYGIFTFDKNTPFPSYYALIPTVGAALIINYTNPSTLVGKILNSKILVSIGIISYSAYLWHQPLFSFGRQLKVDNLSKKEYLILIILTIILSYLNWIILERKFRNKNFINRKFFIILTIFFSLTFGIIGYLGYKNNGYKDRFQIAETVYESIKMNDIGRDCFDQKNLNKNSSFTCTIGDVDNEKINFIVFGDSHSLSALPAFNKIAKNNHIKGAYVGASGCIPLMNTFALRDDQDLINCKKLNDKVFEYVKENKINKVFLISRWTYYTDGGYKGNNFSYISSNEKNYKSKMASREAFNNGINQTLENYSKLLTNIYFVTQVPQQKTDPLIIYSQVAKFNQYSLSDLSISMNEHKQLQNYVNNIFISNSVNLIDLDGIFCNSQSCSVGNTMYSFYYDADHLSIEGSKLIEKEIEKYLLD